MQCYSSKLLQESVIFSQHHVVLSVKPSKGGSKHNVLFKWLKCQHSPKQKHEYHWILPKGFLLLRDSSQFLWIKSPSELRHHTYVILLTSPLNFLWTHKHTDIQMHWFSIIQWKLVLIDSFIGFVLFYLFFIYSYVLCYNPTTVTSFCPPSSPPHNHNLPSLSDLLLLFFP